MERIRIEISDGRKPTVSEIIAARTSSDTHADWDTLVLNSAGKEDLQKASIIMGRDRFSFNGGYSMRREGYDDR